MPIYHYLFYYNNFVDNNKKIFNLKENKSFSFLKFSKAPSV